MDVSNLRGLGNSSAVLESLPAVVSDCIGGIVGQATEHEEASNRGACPAFARIAVDNHDVL